jgi:hypothetical protein
MRVAPRDAEELTETELGDGPDAAKSLVFIQADRLPVDRKLAITTP